ncbi:MAG TPA: helix-turn-helix transcriptional regulator [Firmicutes bacterium]|nr:helix-turn-helix transcriptional regulator [Bacillota bacterium]
MRNRIRELRRAKNIAAADLADDLNISTKHLYDLETGKRRLHADIICRLTVIFEVSSDYLLGISSEDAPRDKKADSKHCCLYDMNELPAEARKTLEEFQEYLWQKYGKK